MAALVLPAAIGLSAAPAAHSADPYTDGDFVMGGDLGMLAEVEDRGGKFYEDGVQKDAIEIVSNAGMNMARLRLWVDPYTSAGEPYGGGTNDLATTIEVAQRAKADGMGIMLDFHLSDWWADPGTQTKPKAWESLSYSALKTTVHDYTESVINEMRAAGVLPDMVQMGNETSAGILWEDGRVGGGLNDFTKLGELLSAGITGVNDALLVGEDIETILHLDHGGDNSLYRWWFDGVISAGVDFDIIGLSYYPFWHGTMGELAYNLNDISAHFNKDVMIVETAYGWTLGDGDGLSNSFYTAEEQIGGYPATVQGQIDFLRDLRQIVRDVPGGHGRGIVWWEPTWLPVEGAHWGSEAGKIDNNDGGTLSNPWDNQTLFDWSGETLDSLYVFGETAPTNRAANPSFEADGYTNTPTNWNVWTRNATDANAVYTEGFAVQGDYKLTHWKATAYEASTYQTVTGLPNGRYDVSAWVLSSGGHQTAQFYAKNYGGAQVQSAIPASPSSWVKLELNNVQVTNGQIEIGFYSNANAGNWINIDNVSLTPSP